MYSEYKLNLQPFHTEVEVRWTLYDHDDAYLTDNNLLSVEKISLVFRSSVYPLEERAENWLLQRIRISGRERTKPEQRKGIRSRLKEWGRTVIQRPVP